VCSCRRGSVLWLVHGSGSVTAGADHTPRAQGHWQGAQLMCSCCIMLLLLLLQAQAQAQSWGGGRPQLLGATAGS